MPLLAPQVPASMALLSSAPYVVKQQDTKYGYLDILFTDRVILQAKYYLDNGPPTHTYSVSDQFTISKTIGNSPPVANAQSVTVSLNTPKAVPLTASDADGDSLTYSVVTPPTHGTLSGTAPSLTYTPTANYLGPDSFTFKTNDGAADSNTATVSITVKDPSDTTPPTVVTTNPSSATTGIPTTSLITATFSEPVQRSTVTDSTFLLKNSAGTSISGTVSLSADDKTATFDPPASLSVSTTYTATISPDSLHRVMDPSGNRMPTKTWSFTTGTTADTTQPTVVTTNPASAAYRYPNYFLNYRLRLANQYRDLL